MLHTIHVIVHELRHFRITEELKTTITLLVTYRDEHF
jgi:hypothetical protein